VKLCGGRSGDWPLGNMTEEIHTLAADLRNSSFIDIITAGRAETILWLIYGIMADFYQPKKQLTEDEKKVKGYLMQVQNILNIIFETGHNRRFQPSHEKLQEYAGHLEHFAGRLDDCPTVTQYRDYWYKLKTVSSTGEQSTVAENNPNEPSDEEEWSDPMPLTEMMRKVNISGYKKFRTWGKRFGLREAGNRQLWEIRLDNMDHSTRKKFKKSY